MFKGKIVNVGSDGLTTVAFRHDLDDYIKKGHKEVWVIPIDNRKVSPAQRRACWALISEIADFVGDEKNNTNRELKFEFLAQRAERLGYNLDVFFSLSNAPMDLIHEYQMFLVEFILRFDIPTTFSLLDMIQPDMISDYLYNCLIRKKCFVCGKTAELHHVDRVGMGRDRKDILHIGMEAVSLCRLHHTENHNIGEKAFQEKHHYDKGIEIDKTIARIYKLGGKNE